MARGDRLSFVVVSYVPLLTGEAGRTVDVVGSPDAVELVERVESMPSGWAEGCIWAQSESGSPYPVLIISGARRIAEHLAAWAEGDPADWFDLHVKSRGDKYAVALIPRVRKSVERFEMAYHLRNGLPVPPGSRYNIIFKPLHFCTGSGTTFRRIRHLVGPESRVGLVDPDDLHPSDISMTDDSAIVDLGTFRVGPNKPVERYMDGLLDGATKPVPSRLDRYRPG